MPSKALVALALVLAAGTAWAAPPDDVRALLEQGKAKESYGLGKQHPDLLGQPEFDFYFGIAAIEAGHAGEGVLALERYLLAFPDNASARLMVARGYFALGENARARDEFSAILATKPPADVQATIERYLDVIRTREARYATTAGAFIEAGIGHDTNINSGVSGANITLPVLGPVLLDPSGQKISSAFLSVAAGAHVTHPIAPGIALFGAVNGDRRFHDGGGKSQFEQGNVNAAGGVSFLTGPNLFRLGASYGELSVGNDRYRSMAGVSGEWQHQISEQQLIGLGAQWAQLDHADPNAPRDADFYGLSASYRVAFSHAWQPSLALGLNLGRQHSRRDRADLVPETWAVNTSFSFTPAAKWGAAVGYFYQQSDYRGPDVFLNTTRADRYHALTGNVAYYYSRSLSFRGELQVIRNRSNIELYAFPRELAAFKVRYEFN
ncbi:MAG: DUF560 domain-containing protein [Burkholderiales bacterium]|nr:DUF560 domain-containing protein [Burkholderiales bacterium]